jgi:hypothetical protein
MTVVRVIGRGIGTDDGDRDDMREERAFRLSGSEGIAASRSFERSSGIFEDREACNAFAYIISESSCGDNESYPQFPLVV